MRVELPDSIIVAQEGGVPDPENPQVELRAVTLTLPGFRAHTLSHQLALWTWLEYQIEPAHYGSVREALELAQALHKAAEATGIQEAVHCPGIPAALRIPGMGIDS